MPNTSSVLPWALTMPAGSLQQWNFTFTLPPPSYGPTQPYPISGYTWEYVVRTSAADMGTPLIDLTISPDTDGVLVVTSTSSLSQVLVEIYPAATEDLDGEYWHALWMNPGTNQAFTWVTGPLLIQGNPQPIT